MLSRLRTLYAGRPVHLWDQAEPGTWGDPLQSLEEVADRWRRYRTRQVDSHVSEHDDMLHPGPDAERAYLSVGLSALRIMTEAMVLSGRTRFDSVLDLPCGGGRVTRHLQVFFDDSEIHVADIDEDKQAAVVDQFGATAFPFPHDFASAPARTFDLIFSGSLLTHFNRSMFDRSLDFFIQALAPRGIAILTTHGRTSATHAFRSPDYEEFRSAQLKFVEHVKETRARVRTNFDPDKAALEFKRDGFGYFATPYHSALYGQSYGGSFSTPSWLMERIEKRRDCIVLGFKERSYDNMQDVIMVQKL